MDSNILLFIKSGHSLEAKLKKINPLQTSVYNMPKVPDFINEIDLIIITNNFCDTLEKTQSFINLLRQDFKKPVIEFAIIPKGEELPPRLSLCNRHFYDVNELLLWLNKTFLS